MLKTIVKISFILTIGCGGPIATKCHSQYFGSVESVLPLNCDLFDADTQLAGQIVALNTQITFDNWVNKMHHVHVRVKSVEIWDSYFGEVVDGTTIFTQIALDKHGISLAHESLHAFDIVQDFENVGTIIESPVLLSQEMEHYNWGPKGYWNADHAYSATYCPFQSDANNINTSISNCLELQGAL